MNNMESDISSTSNKRNNSIPVNAASAGTVRSHVTINLSIACISPSSTEGVLDKPVGNVVAVDAETDEQHDMVDLLIAAVKRADDTAGVELEGEIKGVDADGHGALL